MHLCTHGHAYTCSMEVRILGDSSVLGHVHHCQRAVSGRCLCSLFLNFFSEVEQVSVIPLLSNHCFQERLTTVTVIEKNLSVIKSCPTLATPWMVPCQAPLSMGFSRQEYWSELPFPSSGDLPNPGIEAGSPALQADTLPTEIRGKPARKSRSI